MKKSLRKLSALFAVLCLTFVSAQSEIVTFATEIGADEEDGAENSGFAIDNTGTLLGYDGSGGDVIVPSSVTAVAAGVFTGNTSLTSVTLPSSVTMLGTGIFANCTNLTTVTIQGSISSIPAQTFYNCENLRSIYVPTSVSSIGADAFAECVSLSGITIPSAVTSIGDRAFNNCISLGGVSIPASVSSIGSNAFRGCSGMTSYSVSEANGQYSSSGGCLYNKTKTRLISCPEGRSNAAIAEGTKIIGSNAFYDCSSIHSLTLPKSVTTIEANAFAGSGISDITILSGVTSIGAQSGWTADIIYGEKDSAAEVYANSNSIVFQPLKSSAPSDTENKGDQEDSEKQSSENGNKNNGSGQTGNSGNRTNTESAQNGASSAPTAYSSSNNVSAAATAGQKDVTPKTGEEINPVFLFCLAFLLIGVALLCIGRKKTVR